MATSLPSLAVPRGCCAKTGQRDQSKEMCERVYGCHSYDDALFIISEYVETELSDPDHMAAREKTPKPKERGDAR